MLRPLIKFWYLILVKFFWKKIPGLLKFQATEAESAWQLEKILPRLPSEEHQRDVFEHYMEEMYHAELFADQAKKQAISQGLLHLPRLPVAEREPILEKEDDLWKFFAFLSVGEASAVRQFSKITHALPDSTMKKTLRGILRDESKHVVDAKRHAWELAPADELKRYSAQLKRARFKAEWMRQGLLVTDTVSSALLWAVYWILMPLGYRAAKRKIYGEKPKPASVPLPLALEGVKI